MFSRDTGRGYLSLQDQDAEYIGSSNFDALAYDQGVIGTGVLLHVLAGQKAKSERRVSIGPDGRGVGLSGRFRSGPASRDDPRSPRRGARGASAGVC